MRLGKDIRAVYECRQEDILNRDNLEEWAKALLDYYENGVRAKDHIMVEDTICSYIKLKGFRYHWKIQR